MDNDKETLCYTGSPSDEVYKMLVFSLGNYCRQTLDEYQESREIPSIGQVRVRSRDRSKVELEAAIYAVEGQVSAAPKSLASRDSAMVLVQILNEPNLSSKRNGF